MTSYVLESRDGFLGALEDLQLSMAQIHNERHECDNKKTNEKHRGQDESDRLLGVNGGRLGDVVDLELSSGTRVVEINAERLVGGEGLFALVHTSRWRTKHTTNIPASVFEGEIGER